MLPAIADPLQPEPAEDPFEAALEACCAALVTVQRLAASASLSSSTSGNGSAEDTRPDGSSSLRETIGSLRWAIDSLRSAYNPGPHAPIVGFVLGADAGPSGTVASLNGQSRPRRTA